MREFNVRNFDKGLITKVEDFSIDESAASRSLNWLTLGDKIELTGGYSIVGDEANTVGKITGLLAPQKVDGSQLLLRTRGQKVEYLNSSDVWTESGSDLLGTDADGEDVSISAYTSLAGYQAWFSSPNSGLYKMMLANPDSIVDHSDGAGVYRGRIAVANNALYLWGRKNNKNYLYRSHKDVQNSSVYTSVSAEAIGGSGSTNYTGTLSAITGSRTCFNVVFTDGTLTAQDDKNGGFIGDATGTINYATGAYDITFDSTTTGSVTADYQYEDSTINGLADFGFTATRTANEGFFLPQATGGDLNTVVWYKQTAYCLHETNAWIFDLAYDDVTVNAHEEWRTNIGLQNHRAAIGTGDGIYYIDTSLPSQPRFKLLTLQSINTEVIPTEISFNVDLSGYDFSESAAFAWGDYILFACKVSGASQNNRLFAYHRGYKTIDMLGYYVSCMTEYNNYLVCGDSAINDTYQAFTGFSANGSVIQNYWEGKLTKLGLDEIKKVKRFTVRGEIGPDQEIEVFLAYDGGQYASIGTIRGDGSYVDKASAVTIGGPQIGTYEVGGGGSGITAYRYIREFRINTRRFDEIKVKFVANSVGYASVTEENFYDIRVYGQKNLQRYRTT